MTVFVSARRGTGILSSYCGSALWKTNQKVTSFFLKGFQVAFCRVNELQFHPSHHNPIIFVGTFQEVCCWLKKSDDLKSQKERMIQLEMFQPVRVTKEKFRNQAKYVNRVSKKSRVQVFSFTCSLPTYL